MTAFQNFLKRKNIEFSMQRYGIEAMGAMAQGLFCSLLIGTIINTVANLSNLAWLKQTVAVIAKQPYTVGGLAMAMSGPAMAIAIGYALKCPPLVLFSLTAVGFASNALGGAGGPIAVLFVSIITAEIGKAIAGETKIDILVTPFVTIVVGSLLSELIAPFLGKVAMSLGEMIMWATLQQPFIMGILVSVFVGIALTLPISSAAICAALGLTGLAGGAALAGCSAQMIGFAILSYSVNHFGGFIAQGLGTSMLQMPNIVKKPVIWLPATLASAITGPIATCIFKLEMNGAAINSGMGTCGLCGPIGVIQGWLKAISAGTKAGISSFDWLALVMICLILPAVLTWLIGQICFKLKLFKPEDLKL